MKNWGTLTITLLILLAFAPLISAEDLNNSNDSVSVQAEIIPLEIPTIQLYVDSSIELGEIAELEIGINPKERNVTKIIIKWGDGDEEAITSFSLSILGIYSITKEHEYDNEDDFTILVEVDCEGDFCNSEDESIDVKEPEIIDEDPTVTLISPSNNLEIKADKVTFKFETEDDFKIDICTFELYLKEGSFKKREYTEDIANPQSGSQISIDLEDFEDANYTWYVTCKDNNSQSDDESRAFSIQTTRYEQQKELEGLLVDLEDFIKKQDSLPLDEQKALEELGITEDLKYFNKKLIQIDLDLGNNIKFISDSTKREKRRIETIEEYEKIKEEIPQDVEIISSDEYIKNSVSIPFEEITLNYSNAKSLDLDKRKIRKLAEMNLEAQGKISTSIEIKKIRLTYADKEEDLSIIRKELKISDNSFNRVLEIFPGNFNEEIEFKTKAGKLNENMYEINLNDLDKNEIIYYVKEDIGINKLKDTETVLFEEFSTNRNILTGFAVFNSDNMTQKSIIISVILTAIGLIIFFFFPKKTKVKAEAYSKDPNVAKMIYLLKSSNEEIKKENIEKAKENYHEIKKIYPALPEEVKQKAYNKVEELRIEIDKREMRDLVREYETIKAFDKVKANAIYNKIKSKYTRLPQKFQQKIYERIILKN
ncbi:MAG: hypothetical protein PF542_03370 [Nanoarchaeota archaeon]|jgi:hypothetical protein|nr:hypothetical protein [Nanoarchaeota archaeon]